MINIPDTRKKRIVIVGGGFAGLTLAKKLDDKLFQTVLIDKNNYHQFPPLLYQVASSGLSANSISFPFRKIFHRKKDFYFRLANVEAIDAAHNKLKTNIGTLFYDYLIIAAGTTTNYYGNDSIRENAIPMKTVEQALELRNELLLNFEKALNVNNSDKEKSLLNIVVVGGGATGVEIAGAIAEMKRFVIPKDYPDLKTSGIHIYLVEGTDHILGNMSDSSSKHALRFLKKMGVTVLLNKMVEGYEDGKVVFQDGEHISTQTLIWVSGITANVFKGIEKDILARGNRVKVNEFNQIKNTENIYAIGDICLQTEKDYPNGYPQVAPVAIQQGKALAKNFKAMHRNKPLSAFHYRNKGTLATIGRNKAVADLPFIHLKGFFAWVVWMVVHLRSILGVQNKVMVLINWVWNYFTYDRSTRFILYIPKRKRTDKRN